MLKITKQQARQNAASVKMNQKITNTESAEETISEQAKNIAHMTARIEALECLLENYIENFDDDALSNAQVKRWLDSIWLPSVRETLAERYSK